MCTVPQTPRPVGWHVALSRDVKNKRRGFLPFAKGFAPSIQAEEAKDQLEAAQQRRRRDLHKLRHKSFQRCVQAAEAREQLEAELQAAQQRQRASGGADSASQQLSPRVPSPQEDAR